MTAQIDKTRVDIEKLRHEMRWEPWKALASFLLATAAMTTAVVALAHWLAPTISH